MDGEVGEEGKGREKNQKGRRDLERRKREGEEARGKVKKRKFWVEVRNEEVWKAKLRGEGRVGGRGRKRKREGGVK